MFRLLIAWYLQGSGCLWEYRVRGDTGKECSEIIMFLLLFCAQVCRGQQTIAVDEDVNYHHLEKMSKIMLTTDFSAQEDRPFSSDRHALHGCFACSMSFLLSCVVYSVMEPDITPPSQPPFLCCVILPVLLFNSPSSNCLLHPKLNQTLNMNLIKLID